MKNGQMSRCFLKKKCIDYRAASSVSICLNTERLATIFDERKWLLLASLKIFFKIVFNCFY